MPAIAVVVGVLIVVTAREVGTLIYTDSDVADFDGLLTDDQSQFAEVDAQYEPVEEFAAPASRNAPCPCGSGLKYKQCHGKI